MAMANPYNYNKPKGFVNLQHNPAEKLQTKQRAQSDVYLEQKVFSAKPEELTLMLYDGIVKFIKTAQIYIEENNLEKSNHAIQRAEAIITELQATLNMDYEISQQLDSLYDYMYRRLLDANLEKNVSILEEVLGLAESMRETWKEAMSLL